VVVGKHEANAHLGPLRSAFSEAVADGSDPVSVRPQYRPSREAAAIGVPVQAADLQVSVVVGPVGVRELIVVVMAGYACPS